MKYIILISLLCQLSMSANFDFSKKSIIQFIKDVDKKDVSIEEFRVNYFMAIDLELKSIIKKLANEKGFFEIDSLSKMRSTEDYRGKYISTNLIVKMIKEREEFVFKKNRYLFLIIKVNILISRGQLSEAFEYLMLISKEYDSGYIDEDLVEIGIRASQKAINNKKWKEAYTISRRAFYISESIIGGYKKGEASLVLLKLRILARNELIKVGINLNNF